MLSLSRFQKLTIGALLLLSGVMIVLTILFLRVSQTIQLLEKNNQDQLNQTTVRPIAPETITAATLTDIQASLAAMLSRVEALEQQPNAKTATKAVSSSEKITAALRKQTLYLGSASTLNQEWTETGQELMINSSDYPANTTLVYEAGLSIVNGEAWSRLKNKTTGAIINASEVSHNSSTPTWKTSGEFKLHSGQNRYVVELRSTSGEPANLSGARVILSW